MGSELPEVTRIERDKKVLNLLERLLKEDAMFQYNVPAQIRQNFPDEALVAYLDRIYAQKMFVVDDEQEVQRYFKIHSHVVLKKEYLEYDWQVKPNMEGRVEKVIDQKATILFSTGLLLDVIKADWDKFKVIGRKMSWVDNPFSSKNYRFYEDKQKSMGEGARKGDLVLHIGEEWSSMRVRIPAQSRGIVIGQYKDHNRVTFQAAWESTPKLVEPYDGYANNLWIPTSSVSLVCPNFIEYAKIREKCLREECLQEND